MKKVLLLAIALTAMAMIAIPADSEERLTFRLNLQPGERYLCSMNIDQKTAQVSDGEEQTMEQTMLFTWDYDIISRDNTGAMEILMKYVRIKSVQTFGFQTVEYDSDNPPEYIDPSMKGLRAVVGSELRVTLDPAGKLKAIAGTKEMVEKIIASLDLPDSPGIEPYLENIRQQYGDGAMKQTLERITGYFPDHPVGINDSWADTAIIDTGFPMIIESAYTLHSRQNGIAHIDLSARVVSNPEAEPIAMGQLTLRYDFEGTQSGSIEADETTGLPLKSIINHSFSGTVTPSGFPDLESSNLPISSEGRIEITFEMQ